MDDSMDSVPGTKTKIELYRQLLQLWASAGMHARKWLSNVPEMLECIPSADCVTEVDLDRGEHPVVKTLGVLWSPNKDKFKYQVQYQQYKACLPKEDLQSMPFLRPPRVPNARCCADQNHSSRDAGKWS